MFGELRTAFPDMKVEVDHLVADDDNVAFAYTFSGTHTGEFQGHAPTGKQFSVRGMQISRFVDQKMVERWGSSNQLGILAQLGPARLRTIGRSWPLRSQDLPIVRSTVLAPRPRPQVVDDGRLQREMRPPRGRRDGSGCTGPPDHST